MIDYTKTFATKEAKGFDAGLKEYMLKIYNYMSMALLVTGVMAFATLNFPPLTYAIYSIGPYGELLGFSMLGQIITFAPLGIAMYFFMGYGKMSFEAARLWFWVYAALMGVSLSSLGIMYTGYSIAKTFFVCASVFGAVSIYGYTTQKDLTSMGSFMVIGLIGLIVVSLINILLQSPAIEFATSFAGVGIFIGLIAWDTQKLKAMYHMAGGGIQGQKMAVAGAFTLYLDFINLFLSMLRLMGNRK